MTERKSEDSTKNILMIAFDQGAEEAAIGWYIAVQNNPNLFPFMGDNPDEQMLRVNRLGELMQEWETDPDALIDELPVLLNWPATLPSGEPFTSNDMVQLLFDDTAELSFSDEIIYEVPEEAAAIIDFMIEAGEAIVAAAAA
ncbi:hypothetical protein GWI72_05420 [Microvirga tunisiensis]|uniref:Uncharacterized protein n=1 Tax=Pannonibacter tanglangensis TaxID=2750084 RepID=A0A7X5F0U7_9HYPH|nr:hypothetical protein [Pannonibacter sp. XCT-53]NBN77705.1 hypothetical protein [Pannonibacter sp. XCT-53]